MSRITPNTSVLPGNLGVEVASVREVEECAARAWPATEIEELDGWKLRYSQGVSNRRANSVLPLQTFDARSVERRIAAAEEFYGARGLPARFMVSPGVLPADLDMRLAERGYAIEAPTIVQWADTDGVTADPPAALDVHLRDFPSDAWMRVYMEGAADTHEIEMKRRLFERIAGEFTVAEVVVDGEPVSVGLAVRDSGWAGLFCMHTLSGLRRRGFATACLAALVDWARASKIRRLYLQVECDNPIAREFYERAGFISRYGYHYRRKEIGDDGC